jgi:hypothetical protein
MSGTRAAVAPDRNVLLTKCLAGSAWSMAREVLPQGVRSLPFVHQKSLTSDEN